MAFSRLSYGLAFLVCFLFLVKPSHAFGAGNIGSTSRIEGQNWRHGDIEDTLLAILSARAFGGKKFSKLDVKRVYFGNWLRDYSQAVDVGTVKYVSAEAIRIILWVLGFMSFGYGTGEFEVTTARLGCYRPEEHIDNPKDYADNEDARQYDRRLRGPVDERRELSIDSRTGLKNYIASEDADITTTAGLVRRLYGQSIELGRRYARSRNSADLYEALRLLGTANHALEDFSAHSNYVELTLIELGERDVFPHVGRNTQIHLAGARHSVYPIITGTFGGVDFLHSVMGEFDDKTTQSELQELEGTLEQSQSAGQNMSFLQELLDKVPTGMFGGKNQSQKASELQANATAHQMQNIRISPREPEEWTRYLEDVQKQIYPILEFHDEIMKSITETIEKIPILPDLIEQIQEQINVFVFSLLAPFIVPIINQIKAELNTGSSEIIQSSLDKQHVVFNDDNSTDPTHSMLSKDHFSNLLNEPAGKVASQVLKWVVPQIVACWDNESIDVDRTLDRIIHGVLHHPALRDQGQDGAADGRRLMFAVVEKWWGSKDESEKYELRQQLSRAGVEQGLNHKPGVNDTGHGCGKPLGMPNLGTSQSSGAVGGTAASAVLGEISNVLEGGSGGQSQGYGGRNTSYNQVPEGISSFASEAVGGGALGGLVSGIAGAVGGGLLSGAFGDNEKQSYQQRGYENDGSYNQSYTEVGKHGNTYGQAEYSRTNEYGGGQAETYSSYEQSEPYRGGRVSGHGYEERVESRPTYEGGFEQTTSTRIESGNEYRERVTREERYPGGGFEQEQSSFSGRRNSNSSSDDSDDSHKKKHGHKKHSKHGSSEFNQPSWGGEPSYGERSEYQAGGRDEPGYGGGDRYAQRPDYEDRQPEYSNRGDEYGGSRREEEYGYGGNRDEFSEARGGGGSGGSFFGGGGNPRELVEERFGEREPREEFGGEQPRNEYNDEYENPPPRRRQEEYGEGGEYYERREEGGGGW